MTQIKNKLLRQSELAWCWLWGHSTNGTHCPRCGACAFTPQTGLQLRDKLQALKVRLHPQEPPPF